MYYNTETQQPLTSAQLKMHGIDPSAVPYIHPLRVERPRYDSELEQLEQQPVALEGSEYVQRYEIVPLPEPTRQYVFAQRVRAERDRRLRASDPAVLPDYPHPDDASKQVWLDYRQALRDLTERDGFPWTGPDGPDTPWPEIPKKP